MTDKAPALQQDLNKDCLAYGIYEQVVNEAIASMIEDAESRGYSTTIDDLSADGSEEYLARYMQGILVKGLRDVRDAAKRKYNGNDKGSDANILKEQIDACNKIIDLLYSLSDSKDILDLKIGEDRKLLLSIWKHQDLIRPKSSISVSRLFTGGASSGFQLSNELRNEIASANRVDFLVSFVKNSGINVIKSALNEFTKHGGKLRILTTTYMGVTEPNIVRELARMPNVEIRISYDAKSTRLHAKAYIFERDNGFSTAYIGSSNLSRAAVTDGMEWNVKITNQDAPQIINEVKSTFDIYWNSKDFEPFDPEKDFDKLMKAIRREKNRDTEIRPGMMFDIFPHPYQVEILEELKAQREVHGNYRNLIIAATGTGKTVVSAFDYLNFVKENKGRPNRLLFIAHRKEILKKSLETYRVVMKDPNFGTLSMNGEEPASFEHLFISIQSFNSKGLEQLDPDYYDYIVVDEVHHGSAPSYQRLLTHFNPKILLGMTATPERLDGADIKQYFNNEFSCELRLPEAINRELLVPFQYYAVTDPADISDVRFENGTYDRTGLTEVYLNNDARITAIVEALKRYQPDFDSIKCLGFCVTVKHAEYMANCFNAMGFRAMAVTSETEQVYRDTAIGKLKRGELQFIFTVDIYNEGVDIPEVNTELMLRPTESKTIFIQQLGRGLRKAENKTELIVLDFVGQYNRKYNVYEQKLRALCSACPSSVVDQINNGFILPIGCYIELEEQARKYILDNLGNGSNGKRELLQKIRDYHSGRGEVPEIDEFCRYYDLDPRDIYRTRNSLFGLCKECGIIEDSIQEGEITPSALLRICSINSRRFISAIERILNGKMDVESNEEKLFATMFYYTFRSTSLPANYRNVWHFFESIRSNSNLCKEILSLMRYNRRRIDFVDEPVDLGFEHTLDLHCSYTKEQILAALGKSSVERMYPWREGTLFIKEKKTDVFLINLEKSEKDYSPTTMYEDYPISEKLFHWQSQSIAVPDKGDGLRYREQDTNGQNTLLFVRKCKSDKYGTMPYVFLGKAKFVSYEGRKPMSIVWEMEKDIPAKVLSWSPLFKG